MHSDRDLRSGRLTDAVGLFKTEFRKRYPESEVAIDGEGFEDEDLDLVIRANGDQIELEQYAAGHCEPSLTPSACSRQRD